MIIAIVGLGLIGGSMAKDLRTNGFASRLIGVDHKLEHQKQALELGLVDEITELSDACEEADVILLAVPVSAMLGLIPQKPGFNSGKDRSSLIWALPKNHCRGCRRPSEAKISCAGTSDGRYRKLWAIRSC